MVPPAFLTLMLSTDTAQIRTILPQATSLRWQLQNSIKLFCLEKSPTKMHYPEELHALCTWLVHIFFYPSRSIAFITATYELAHHYMSASNMMIFFGILNIFYIFILKYL